MHSVVYLVCGQIQIILFFREKKWVWVLMGQQRFDFHHNLWLLMQLLVDMGSF